MAQMHNLVQGVQQTQIAEYFLCLPCDVWHGRQAVVTGTAASAKADALYKCRHETEWGQTMRRS